MRRKVINEAQMAPRTRQWSNVMQAKPGLRRRINLFTAVISDAATTSIAAQEMASCLLLKYSHLSLQS
jgi:hypothetical protein